MLPNPDQRHLLHIDDVLHGDLLHGVHSHRLDDRSLA